MAEVRCATSKEQCKSHLHIASPLELEALGVSHFGRAFTVHYAAFILSGAYRFFSLPAGASIREVPSHSPFIAKTLILQALQSERLFAFISRYNA